jgi:hypothetical protein
MRPLCKISWTQEEAWEEFCSKLPFAIVEMKEKRILSAEEWFDRHGIRKDAIVGGDVVQKRCTFQQLYMQWHMILDHQANRDRLNTCHEKHIRDKQEKQDQWYNIATSWLKK